MTDERTSAWWTDPAGAHGSDETSRGRFVDPTDRHADPTDHYGNPTDHYGNPGNDYVDPAGRHAGPDIGPASGATRQRGGRHSHRYTGPGQGRPDAGDRPRDPIANRARDSLSAMVSLAEGAAAMLAALIAAFVITLIAQTSISHVTGVTRYLPFALASAAVRAPVRLAIHDTTFGAVDASLRITAQAGLVFAAFVAAVVVAAYSTERRRPPTSGRGVAATVVARAIGAAAAGLVVALLGHGTLHQTQSGLLANGDITITASVAGTVLGSFLFALVIGGGAAALLAWRRLAAGADGPVPSMAATAQQWMAAARAVRSFSLVGAALATVVDIGYFVVSGLPAGGWKLWLAELPLGSFGSLLLFTGAGVHAGLDSSYTQGDNLGALGLFAGGSGALFAAALLVPIVAVAVAGLRTALRDPARPFGRPAVLRVAVLTVAAALVLALVMSVRVRGSGDSGLGDSLGGYGTEHVGFGVVGVVVAAACWGGLLGALGPGLAPIVLRSAPGLAAMLAGKQVHPSWTTGSHSGDVGAAARVATTPTHPVASTQDARERSRPAAFARPTDPTAFARPTDATDYPTAAFTRPTDYPTARFARPLVIDTPEAFAPFWFAVTRDIDVYEPTGGARIAFRLEPGEWYLAIDAVDVARGQAPAEVTGTPLRVTLDSGLTGILYDVAQIHRAP